MSTCVVRHLDLYLTVAAAVTLGALGALNIIDSGTLAGTTLATLGLLALTTLSGRLQLQALDASIAELTAATHDHLAETAPASRALTAAGGGIGLDLDGARDVRLMGVTLSRTLRHHMDGLQRRLADGAFVRIALVEPGGAAVLEAARRSGMGDTPEIFEHRLRACADLLRRLDPGPGWLEVRRLDFVPSYGLVAADPDRPHGRMRVEIYTHGPATSEPTLTLLADRDGRWFRHFAEEFERIWANGRTVE